MKDLIEAMPADLPAWAYVVILLGLAVIVFLIAKATGNSSKKSFKISNVKQDGIGNNQQLGENINNYKDK